MGEGWVYGAPWGLGAGAFLGAIAVYYWGLCGVVPRWAYASFLGVCGAASILMSATRLWGLPPDFWWAFAACFPHSFLPLFSLAYSAHSYVVQSVSLAAYCLYLGAILWVSDLGDSASLSFLLGGFFLALPFAFAWGGQLHRVQAWNDFFWGHVRRRLAWLVPS